MRIYFILFILLVSTQSYCQSFYSGFIVKHNGDSSKVLVKELLPSKSLEKCIVKEEGRTNHYSAIDLAAYGYYGGSRFETIEINNRKFFTKVLVKGTLSLYQEGSTFYIKEKEIIALSNSKKEPNNYIEILNSIIQDCGLTANEIGYTEKELTSIVQNYNRCNSEAGNTFKQKLAKTSMHYSVKVGYSKNTMNAVSKAAYESSSISYSIPISIGAEFSLPRFYKKLFLTSDFVFEKNQYQFYDESSKYTTVTRRDVLIKATTLKIPIGLKYTLFSINNSPFLSVGISPTVYLGETQDIIEEKESGSVVTTTTSNGSSSISQTGFWFGLGYTQSLYQKISLIVEGKYESFSGSIGGDLNYNTSGNCLSLTVGIRY